MALTLEVVNYKGIPSVNPLRARFEQGGGTVGRSLDNNLPLPDEDKVISRYHGNIRYQNGGFVYIDTSTGGTLLCNKNRLLEKEDSVVLADGDHLKIGEYELVVRIEPEEQPFPGLFSDLGGQQAFADNRVGSGFGVNIQPLFGYSELLPEFGQNTPPSRPPTQNDSFISQPDVPPFQESFTLPEIQKPLEDFSFDGALQGGNSSSQPAAANKDDFEFLDDWFGNLGTDAEMPDRTPDQALDPFLPSPQIPPKEAVMPPIDAHQGQIDKTVSVGGHSSASLAGIGFIDNDTGLEPLASTRAKAINIPKPGGQPIPSAKMAATVSPPADPSPHAKTPPPYPLPESATGVDLFRCFLEGAGILEILSGMTQEEQIKAMKSVGQVYREMVDGMMKVLHARKMEQSMIALRQSDVTQFRRGECNPLKIFPTAEETMEEMMRQKNPAYIAPAEAVKEGFADIMNHQLAMRAGMQAAMSGFLKRVDPKTFDDMFKDGIIFQKKAKCWDAYGKAYPKLVEEAMDDLFGENFAEAYREQLRILRQSQQSKA